MIKEQLDENGFPALIQVDGSGLKGSKFSWTCGWNDAAVAAWKAASPVISDRDIKAANLQLLVEKVLAFDAALEQETDAMCIIQRWQAVEELARSLKQ